MLKLVATDMDGTLLTDNKEMPEKIFKIIDDLHKRGIAFAVASGRQHFSLQKLYGEIKDDIIIVAGNGSIIIDKGEIISVDTLDFDVVYEIVEEISKMPSLKATICGLEADYMFEDNVTSTLSDHLVNSHFPVTSIIKSLDDLPEHEKILQIAIYDPSHNSEKNIYDKLKHLGGKCHITVSGVEWVDIIAVGVNKGTAIKKLQQMLGATPEETMVFGDESNDYEMMEQAYYSYAMANAIPKIKEIAKFRAPSNEDEGVVKILENFLSMTK